MFRCVVCVVLFVVVVCGENVRGVPPQEQGKYQAGDFTCESTTGKQKIVVSAAMINDDYCDCLDGVDEPGTPACSQGSFWCENTGHIGKRIPSSFINDKICDCCDGSDEYMRINCENTCWEDGRVARETAQQELATHLEGLRLRDQYVTQAHKAFVDKQEELSLLKTKLVAAEEKVADTEYEHNRVQAEENSKKAELEPEKTEEEKDTLEKTQEDILPAEDSAELKKHQAEKSRKRRERRKRKDKEEEDYFPDLGDFDDYEDEEEKEEKLDEINPDLVPYIEDPPKWPQKDSRQRSSSSWWERTVSFLIWPYSYFFSPFLPLVENSATRAAKKLRDDAVISRDALTSQISQIEKILAISYGDDKCYFSLYDSNIEMKTDEYTYELVPFSKANQKPIKGSATNLGYWDGWESGTTMHYTKGIKCWNGPDRSTNVKLVCGITDSIIEVDEPAKCEYEFVLQTPCACSQEEVDKIRSNLRQHHKEAGHY